MPSNLLASCAELLLQNGAQPDHKDGAGFSTLHSVARHGLHELVPLLAASHQHLVEEKTPAGLTPLILAVQVRQALIRALCIGMKDSTVYDR